MSQEQDPLSEAPGGPEREDENLPAPATRREARERAAVAESRAQRRAEAEAALAAQEPVPATRRRAARAAEPEILGVTDVLGAPSGPGGAAPGSPEPAPRRRGRRALIVTLISVLLVAGLAAGVASTWNSVFAPILDKIGLASPADFDGEGSGQITVQIREGDTGTDVARTLHNAGVTASVEVFYRLLLQRSEQPVFQPGMYSLRSEMSAEAALAALFRPGNRLEGGVLIREGEQGRRILPEIASATGVPLEELEAAAADPASFGVPAGVPSLEGWLFPATYTFAQGTGAREILQAMVSRTRESLVRLGVPEENWERVLTAASVIQREARQSGDFAKVSRVIENRLAQGMMLQMDSTAQYGQGQEDGSVWSSAESLHGENAWNTYTREGLPAGPISNPGDLAIEAAVTPAEGDWLFFVTVNLDTGETVFTTTNAEHETAIRQLRAWCSENPDKGC